MNTETMMNLRDMLCKKLDEYARSQKMTSTELDVINKLTDSIKNIDKIIMLNRGGADGYSQAHSYYGGDVYGGRSRDEQGRFTERRYSRDGGQSYGNMPYDGGSYQSPRETMIRELTDIMSYADERDKEAIRKALAEIKR